LGIENGLIARANMVFRQRVNSALLWEFSTESGITRISNVVHDRAVFSENGESLSCCIQASTGNMSGQRKNSRLR
jgi:hypothetical protein